MSDCPKLNSKWLNDESLTSGKLLIKANEVNLSLKPKARLVNQVI